VPFGSSALQFACINGDSRHENRGRSNSTASLSRDVVTQASALHDLLNHEVRPPIACGDDSRARPSVSAGRTRSVRGDSVEIPSTSREIELLCRFRYHIAPWLDNNNSASFFGVGLLSLARGQRAVTAAILALALQHLLLTSRQYENLTGLGSRISWYREEAEHKILTEPPEIQYVVQSILLLQKVLSASPQDWRSLTAEFSIVAKGLLLDELAVPEAIWWLWLRIGNLCYSSIHCMALLTAVSVLDLATSILSSCSPSIDLLTLRQPRLSPSAQLKVPNTQSTPLLLLAAATSLVYDRDSADSPASITEASQAHKHSTTYWLDLWSDCQRWYRRRSPEMRPVLSCGAVEAAHIDPSNAATLPIELYSSSQALLTNIAYHMTCLLLLSRKPHTVRLPSVDSTRQALSESWHVQMVAGIASKNEFEEQWDPILIAALVGIGPKLTHKSQRDTIIACLKTANQTTGFILDDAVKRLHEGWAEG
jgi:hypothetical protein